MTKKRSIWIALIVAMAMVSASCGDDDEAPAEAPAAPAEAPAEPAEEPDAPAEEPDAPAEEPDDDHADHEDDEDHMDETMDETMDDTMDDDMDETMDDDMDEPMAEPGEGVSVTQGRANWSTGYMQAAIYHDLLEELGYDVSDPGDLELAPSNAYLAMAEGEFDFWVNSWFPIHYSFTNAEMPDGSQVSDHVSVVGEEMVAGGLQGFLTNKSLVDEHGIKTLDQILADPELVAIYDAADTTPGDGVIQVLGCPEGWGCRVTINETFEIAGWDNIEQIEIGSYDAVIGEAYARNEDGRPYIVYTWAPSAYVANLVPGVDAVWLSQDESTIHDGSLTPELNQQGPPAALGDNCSNDPCLLTFVAADIQVTAANGFLEANPAAAKLLELVKISPVDVALQNVVYDGGANTEDDVRSHAAEWIAANRDLVDGWLAEARAAA